VQKSRQARQLALGGYGACPVLLIVVDESTVCWTVKGKVSTEERLREKARKAGVSSVAPPHTTSSTIRRTRCSKASTARAGRAEEKAEVEGRRPVRGRKHREEDDVATASVMALSRQRYRALLLPPSLCLSSRPALTRPTCKAPTLVRPGEVDESATEAGVLEVGG
jgi:hypothetical protein